MACMDLERGEHTGNSPSFHSSVEDASRAFRSSPSISSRGNSSNGSFSIPSLLERDDMARIETANSLRGSALRRYSTAASRIATQRSQHSATVGAGARTRSPRGQLPDFGAGKPYPPPLPEKEDYVVEFIGPDDPLHPQNWTTKKKVATSVILAFTTFTSSFTSSIFSSAIPAVSQAYGVSNEVGTLGMSLYVLGFATGPTLFSPLSELLGRRLPILIAMLGFTLFQFAVATAKDLQTVIICRFFAGFFGACPLAVVAAVLSDIYDNRYRGLAITLFTMMVFTGPLLSPFVGGFIVGSYLGWRWTAYIPGIMGAAALTLNVFFMDETYPPTVLVEKAAELRRWTKNWGIHAKQEEIEINLGELLRKNFTRPIRILVMEPILLSLSIYMAFLYGLLYLFMSAYPIVFEDIHGFNKGVGGLCYFGMIIGELVAGVLILLTHPWYIRKLDSNDGLPVPEWRLPPAILGGVTFAGGLFFFGWTGFTEEIHWIVPTVAGGLIGFGLFSIFLQCLNYIVDTYLVFAASALAANSILRSSAGAGFPLFATYMFNGLGVNWTGTLLGCVAAIMSPIPVLFYLYGHKIRARSKFAGDYVVTAQAHGNDNMGQTST